MRIRLLLMLAGAWLLVRFADTSRAEIPPPPSMNMPGRVEGQVRTWWLAPYVTVTTQSAGPSRMTTVRWLTHDGKIDHELAGSDVSVQPGFVIQYRQGATTIHAVNGKWNITLPQKAGPAGYLTSNEDGRVFVHEFHPKEGEIAADVYVEGKLAGTIGPYLQYQGQDVQVGVSGSLALLIWKDQEKKVVQVVAVGPPDGRERFRSDCEGPVISPQPDLDGTGVLVQTNAGGDAQNTFTFYRKSGKVSSLNVGPNARFLAWLPGTTQALFETSIGYAFRLHLIDWQNGKRLWEVADPNPARAAWGSAPVALDKEYVLLGGLEYVSWGEHQETIRSVYALNTKTGRSIAQWLPVPLYQRSSDAGRFMGLGRRLYLVTDTEFAELDLTAIAAKRNGWK
jgi:hypothetical protein